MIDEQIKELRELADISGLYGEMIINQAIDTIETLSAKLQAVSMEQTTHYGDGWIPCKERLPEEDGFYLVTLTDRITDIADMRIMKIYFSKTSNSFVGYGDTVIAWQPLPEPYHEP